MVVLILLGYFAVTLFFLSFEQFYIFDFLAWRLPLAFSDFVGLPDLYQIILHRGIYFFGGLVFTLLAILTFNRLPQARLMQILRNRMRQINSEYLHLPNITPIAHDIRIEHTGEQITGQSVIRFTNQNKQDVRCIYFSLNPGLKVTGVTVDDTQVQFGQKVHICEIVLPQSIKTGRSGALKIQYTGVINEGAAYLDITEEKRQEPFYIWLYQIPKKYAFVTPDYVLLTPEVLWYPKIGLPSGVGFPDRLDKPFIDFTLKVSTKSDLTAISQGVVTRQTDGRFEFLPDNPLTAVSLIVGPYLKETIMVDSIEFGLYTMTNHKYYIEHLSAISDTLGDIIHDTFQDFEVRLDLNYPYKRLNLIEVPLQFYAYPRLWTAVQEAVQPEQIWIQEDAASLFHADFGMGKSMMERRLDWSNQSMTDLETQTTLLTNFFNYTFLGKKPRRFFFGGIPVSYQPDYNIFPNFYSFNFFISDTKWQIFNSALEAFLINRVRSSIQDTPPWLIEGLTAEEEANILLRDESLSYLLQDSVHQDKLPGLLKQKGSFLIKLLQNESGTEIFNQQLKAAITNNRFSDINFAKFLSAFDANNLSSFNASLEKWFSGKGLPSFYTHDVQLLKVRDRDRIRSQITFKVTNLEDKTGLIEVSFRYSRRGRGASFQSGADEDPPVLYRIAPKQSKRIGLLLDEEPRAITINYLLANNLPLIYSKRFEDAELNEKIEPFHGEEIIPAPQIYDQSQEIIVDNEDPGFVLYNPPYESVLKQMIHGEDQGEEKIAYQRFEWWSPAPQWTLIKNAVFYGTYIHSAYYIRSGDGQRHAIWKTELPEAGIYDIYAYMFDRDNFWRGRRRRGGELFGNFEYIVKHDTGEERVRMSTDEQDEGWFYLGSWYFSGGQSEVMLTNKSDGRLVIADAVKWVKN